MIDATPTTKTGVDWAWLAKMAPRAALVGLLAGWILALVVDAGSGSGPPAWGGDYPAFQTAGRIVLHGDVSRLYDAGTQQAAQQGMRTEGFLPFLYPPFVALFYAPFAVFSYRVSYALFTLLSFGALLASVRLMAPVSPTVRADFWRALAGALFFYPLLRSTLGGQNTAISLLLLCGAWRLFCEKRDLLAGVVLGLLAYKPQLLAPVAGLVLLSGRPRAIAGIAISVVVLFAVSATMMGWNWPVLWWSAASAFADIDRQVNAPGSVSLSQVATLFGRPEAWSLLPALLAGRMAWFAWRTGPNDFFVVFASAFAACLLVAPHAMYYDVGLVLPSILLLADRGHGALAAGLWACGAAQLLAPPLPLSPLLVLLLALLVALGSTAQHPDPGSGVSGGPRRRS